MQETWSCIQSVLYCHKDRLQPGTKRTSLIKLYNSVVNLIFIGHSSDVALCQTKLSLIIIWLVEGE